MTAILTLANAARLTHVSRQAELVPEGVEHIVVALDDHAELETALPASAVIDLGEANLARARNTSAAVAVERGHEHLIFLDADCLPDAELVPRYASGLERAPEHVLSGPVTYLPEGEIRTEDPQPHPARPTPPAGVIEPAEDYNLFWSLSFAVTAETWRAIDRAFGGFDTDYVGYGGEDTDFAWNLRHHGFGFSWLGGAHAYHQWHPVSSPPVEHLDDIVRNANYFAGKWGELPMRGWLDAFADAGLVEIDGVQVRRV